MPIYFLRHASAGDSYKDPRKDEKRPLDEEGALQCRYVGRALASLGVLPDAVISSPLKRALQTASLVGNELGFEGKIQMDAALRPEATFAQFRDLLVRHKDVESILVVGHDPSLSSFLSHMVGPRNAAAHIVMKKGAVARVDTDSKQPTLQWLLTPKAVRSIYEAATASSRPKTSRK